MSTLSSTQIPRKPSLTLVQGLQAIARLPIISDLISSFQSIPFAVTLFILLAIATLIGIMAPQESLLEPDKLELAYGNNLQLAQNLGLTHVFSSFWYITLEVLFFFSILIGSFRWLKAATIAATQVVFLSAHTLSHKPDALSLPRPCLGELNAIEAQMTASLRKAGYTVKTADASTTSAQGAERQLYASKGNITRFGPHIAHIGILLCLIASLLGTFTGYKAQKLALPGATPFKLSVEDLDMFQPNMKPNNLWIGQLPNWYIGVRKFDIETYPNGSPKQYYSELSLYDGNGEVLAHKTISVNNPLMYRNLSIYQASFSPSGRFFLNINGETRRVEINNQFNQRPVSMFKLPQDKTLIMLPFFAGQDEGVAKNYAVFVLRDNKAGKTGTMPPNIMLEEGQAGQLGAYQIAYVKAEMATGLQIKSAPETGLMYVAFGIITVGAILSYFSQRQLWVSIRPIIPEAPVSRESQYNYEIVLYPKTNKAGFSFQKECLALRQTWLNTLCKGNAV
jgi:cytochrome c biogenesis protein